MKPKTELFLRKLPGRIWLGCQFAVLAVLAIVVAGLVVGSVVYLGFTCMERGWEGAWPIVLTLACGAVALWLVCGLCDDNNSRRIEELERALEDGRGME